MEILKFGFNLEKKLRQVGIIDFKQQEAMLEGQADFLTFFVLNFKRRAEFCP